MPATDIRVRDVMMKELMTLAPDERLHLANDLMKLGRVRHMPVVAKGRLVGIVTQRDLFRAAVSSVLRFRARAEREWLEHIGVAEVMTKDVVTAQPDWTVRQAVDTMLERGIGCLPVVEDKALIGLVTETDCLRLLARLLASDGAAPGSTPGS
jgi:CBS domain-containing protein